MSTVHDDCGWQLWPRSSIRSVVCALERFQRHKAMLTAHLPGSVVGHKHLQRRQTVPSRRGDCICRQDGTRSLPLPNSVCPRASTSTSHLPRLLTGEDAIYFNPWRPSTVSMDSHCAAYAAGACMWPRARRDAWTRSVTCPTIGSRFGSHAAVPPLLPSLSDG